MVGAIEEAVFFMVTEMQRERNRRDPVLIILLQAHQ
jgi:hypothetical protein